MNKQAKKPKLHQKLAFTITKPVQKIQIVQKSFSQKMKNGLSEIETKSLFTEKDNVFTFLLC
jgi:hypothetical protein